MIGQGNFGEVHKAVWRKKGEDVNVAVKMQNDKAKEKEKVTFLQEAATMGQFNHPNIVKMFGIVPEEGKSDSCVSTYACARNTHVLLCTFTFMYVPYMHTYPYAHAHAHAHAHTHTHTHTHTHHVHVHFVSAHTHTLIPIGP